MEKVRVWWQVCSEVEGAWECIGTHNTRAEAEAELWDVRSGGWWPKAFLVCLTLTRMDQQPARATTTLTLV